ncbi:MAG: hypothetical protein KBA46_08015, partial [Candidatus Omnitrophica bacterium]|nr:hypothetical protein [Candidatus Omnitrophota bacterium]
QADQIACAYLSKENIISSIVMFGATSLQPGEVVYNFERPWVLGKMFSKNDEKVLEVSKVLDVAFPTLMTDEIQGMKYLKVFVNSNNCIPAILGLSMQEAFSDLDVSRISIAIWKEGLEITRKAGVALVSLPDFPLERMTKLAAMPSVEAAKIFSGIMTGLSKEPMYGSILQSIKRGRASEIDYINGEFVALAKEHGTKAPLNEKLVSMVHEVERTKKFFTKEALAADTKGLLS